LEEVMPSGAHTPGLGLLAFIFLPIISLVLIIYNLSKAHKIEKAYKYSALIHMLFIIGFLILLKIW
jgi:ABC-type Na+ efflux pump permease subunit